MRNHWDKLTKTELFLPSSTPSWYPWEIDFISWVITNIILNQDLQSTAKDFCNCFYYCSNFIISPSCLAANSLTFQSGPLGKWVLIGSFESGGTGGAEMLKRNSWWYFNSLIKGQPSPFSWVFTKPLRRTGGLKISTWSSQFTCELEMNTQTIKPANSPRDYVAVSDSTNEKPLSLPVLPLRGLAGRDRASFHRDSP